MMHPPIEKRATTDTTQQVPHAMTLAQEVKRRIVGQDDAIDAITPYIDLYQAGLAQEGRPVGVFLLLGPTGTGKTRTVEALAAALHGSERNVLRIDCGEFQLEHEVAKLIGAPPGYVGHRATQPAISQSKLNAVASEHSSISLVLLDEIEKAAPSMGRLLLGVLDKAALKLGDNSTVNFERSMIFMTSNLGAREMMTELSAQFGFNPGNAAQQQEDKLKRIGIQAVRKRFSPEFVNRIDHTVVYKPLTSDALDAILDLQLADLTRHIAVRLGPAAFCLDVRPGARQFLLEQGTSREYGARQLKRVIHRHLIQQLPPLVNARQVGAEKPLVVDANPGDDTLSLKVDSGRAMAA